MKGKFDKNGKEIPDSTPIAIPAGFRKPPTLQEQIRSLVRHESYQRLVDSGEIESFDEADDLDIDPSDGDFTTPWENDADEHDTRQSYREALKHERRYKKEIQEEMDFGARTGRVVPKKKKVKKKVVKSDPE